MSLRIIIIEDYDPKFRILSQYVKQCGDVEIVRKTSRNGGLAEILQAKKNNNPYDLLITDLQIPLFENDFSEMLRDGGQEVIYALQEAYHVDIPYMVCSTEAKEEDFLDALMVINFELFDFDAVCDFLPVMKQHFQNLIEKKGNQNNEE